MSLSEQSSVNVGWLPLGWVNTRVHFHDCVLDDGAASNAKAAVVRVPCESLQKVSA